MQRKAQPVRSLALISEMPALDGAGQGTKSSHQTACTPYPCGYSILVLLMGAFWKMRSCHDNDVPIVKTSAKYIWSIGGGQGTVHVQRLTCSRLDRHRSFLYFQQTGKPDSSPSMP